MQDLIITKLTSQGNYNIGNRKQLNVEKVDNLTLIIGSPNSGKNTLLKGLSYATDTYENCYIQTESSEDYNFNANIYGTKYFVDFNVKGIINMFERTGCENLFIEQYTGTRDTMFNDLNTLREYSKTSGKNIYICISSRRQQKL